MTDLIRYVWVFYILGYDSARQNRLLYAPIRLTIQNVRRRLCHAVGLVKEAFARLFHFQSLGSFISLKGFFVSFVMLLFLALMVNLTVSLGKRLLKWWRGPTDDSAGLTAGILFYRRLAQLLAEYELERAPAETQNEFALRALAVPDRAARARSSRSPTCRRRSSRRFTVCGSVTATSILTLSESSRQTSTICKRGLSTNPDQ